jgi:hypothetical protein
MKKNKNKKNKWKKNKKNKKYKNKQKIKITQRFTVNLYSKTRSFSFFLMSFEKI